MFTEVCNDKVPRVTAPMLQVTRLRCARLKYGVAHARRHGTDSQLFEGSFRLLCSFAHCGCFRSSEPFSTDAGLASHRVRLSDEEGLRPKSYYIVFSFVEYAFTDALKYVMAPGSYGAERR